MQSVSVLLVLAVPVAAVKLSAHGDKCSCLEWKDAYANFGVRCGQGYELGQGGAEKIPRGSLPTTYPTGNGFYDEFCTRFYMQVSATTCFNRKFGTPTEQWCYVSSECAGADKVEGTSAAIKMCAEGDDFMNDTTPEDLNTFGTQNKLERGLLGKLSYHMDSEKWSAIESASGLSNEQLQKSHTMEGLYGIKWGGRKEVSEVATSKFQATVTAGRATIFDTDNGHGGGTVVLGSKIYAFINKEGMEGFGYVCLKGCD